MTGSPTCIIAENQHSSETGQSRTVQDEINSLLKYYAYEDAIFLAELYHENENTEESIYIFADCLFRSNKKEELFGLLKERLKMAPKLRYLFAKCCFDLHKLEECQIALLDQETGKLRQELLEDPEVAPHARFLHSSIISEADHPEAAMRECQKVLDTKILMWSVISAYVKYGGTHLENYIEKHRKRVFELSDTSRKPSRTSQNTAESLPKPATTSRITAVTPRKSTRLSEIASKKVSTRTTPMPGPSITPKPAPSSVTRTTQSSRNRSNALSSDTENVHLPRTRGSTISSTNRAAGAIPKTHPTRPSTRASDASKLHKSPSLRKRDVIKQPLSSRNSNLVRSLSGSTNSISSISDEKHEIVDILNSSQILPLSCETAENQLEDVENETPPADGARKEPPIYSQEYRQFFEMFSNLALIEESVGTYNWRKTDKLFAKLDRSVVANSSIARLLLGRTCFEQGEYGECKTILHDLHTKKPWRVEGTELLSTSLWHLQDIHALSNLSATLTTNSRERPQTWCAAGNCFSLQRQHSQAIECMERAIQLDKRFAYAYTLLAHELIVQDELEKAAGAFRTATCLSPRDYRAWYGLGLVHLKREQNSMAQTNIQKAITINPTNRAMLCTLSNLEQQRGKTDKALKLIDRALELNPTDLACRFNRARLLYEAKRNDECLSELNRLKASSPDEAVVFHLLARVHRRMGNSHLSLLNYSWAAELDPRSDQNLGNSGSTGSGNGNGGGHLGGALNRDDEEEYDDDEYGEPE